ncbi:Translation initiation factor eIF-2B subunit gamma [Balamuthia mandrillaris]
MEFQVVILAGGPGSRMYPLTTEMPKPLLPIANRPMISYQLELLERVGFTATIVVAQERAASELKTFVHEIYKGKVNVDWAFLPDYMGTAEALLLIKDKIKRDFIVLSCDTIVDHRFLLNMVDQHRTQDAIVTALIVPPKSGEEDGTAAGAPGAAGGKPVRSEYGLVDYIGLHSDGKRLLYFKAAADVENSMKIHKATLRDYPSLTVYTNLTDAHLYIFSKVVIPILEEKKDKISSIKGELLPYLVHSQFRKDWSTAESQLQRPLNLSYQMTTTRVDLEDKVRCFAFIMERNRYCSRANTTEAYVHVNIEIASRGACYSPAEPLVKNHFIHPAAVISAKTQVGADCVVGQGSTIGERCSIKKSVIGKHCKIGDRVKIINSVIMNHVTIAEGCVINGSVVCNNVDMGAKCSIKDSQVGASFSVPEKTEIKNDALCRENTGFLEM